MKKLMPLMFLTILFLSACSEFIEPSLNDQKIRLIAPSANAETSSYQQTFWWETHNDALQYRLQVVTPTFNNINKLVLDTTIITDKFTYTLDPGNYEWRVRAENGSSATPFATQSFVIYPSSLKEQSVQLVAPANALYTANSSIQYEWLKLFGAVNYRLQVDKNNFIDENNLILNTVTDNLTFVQTLTAEGNYQFRVRAENATETSKWSSVRTFNYDVTPPQKVVLTAPADGQTVTKPIKLTWNTVLDAEKYELMVYKSDSTTPYNTTYPQIVNTNSVIFNTDNVNETVVWQVRAIDKIGNKGAYSRLFSFIIQ